MIWTVDHLGHLGDGVAVGPDGPVYIAGVLPGEEVEGTLTADRVESVRIVTPSDQRVRPPCAHARRCGGCLMQHARDDFVAGWKEGILLGALRGQGLETDLRPILTSRPQSRRRATLSARKTKTGALVGFHVRGSDQLVEVPDCQLLEPGLIVAFPAVEALARLGGSRTSALQVQLTSSPGGPDVVVTGGKPFDVDIGLELARLAETFGLARITWGGDLAVLRAQPVQRFGKAVVAPPPGAFLQATEDGQLALVSAVTETVLGQGKVADLFAGCGTFALPLAEFAEVLAVEGDAPMAAALDRAARQTPGLRPVTVSTRDLFRRPLQPDEFKGIGAVVIDPPRAGAEAQSRSLALARVPKVAMVSCNPATFARDARILVDAGYRLDWVQPVDQFRWSAHVELVASLSLNQR